jgi:hypothetical protein
MRNLGGEEIDAIAGGRTLRSRLEFGGEGLDSCSFSSFLFGKVGRRRVA